MTKICTVCKQEKPLSDYSKSTRAKDGHQYRCKKCATKYRRNPFGDYSPVSISTVASARLLAIPKEPYQPSKDKTYYRNDGNRHIKSYGMPC